jgi:hypothetical protein
VFAFPALLFACGTPPSPELGDRRHQLGAADAVNHAIPRTIGDCASACPADCITGWLTAIDYPCKATLWVPIHPSGNAGRTVQLGGAA